MLIITKYETFLRVCAYYINQCSLKECIEFRIHAISDLKPRHLIAKMHRLKFPLIMSCV